MDIKLITELSDIEKAWWENEIKSFRAKYIKDPKEYAKIVLLERGITREELKINLESIIEVTREKIWQTYLIDEAVFHEKILTHLAKSRDLPKDILHDIVSKNLLGSDLGRLTPEQLSEKISAVVGEFTGRVMPYIYQLSLSTTNSRRSRSGKTFEVLMETLFDIFEYPYGNQSSVGNATYEESNLGKKVDLIVPSIEAYTQNRPKCAVVTMKTSLRERWQEVAEELNRTNVPHIYLLTVDKSVTANTVQIMKRYNITLVLYKTEKESKFKDYSNVQDFQTFFLEEMPHIIGYWK